MNNQQRFWNIQPAYTGSALYGNISDGNAWQTGSYSYPPHESMGLFDRDYATMRPVVLDHGYVTWRPHAYASSVAYRPYAGATPRPIMSPSPGGYFRQAYSHSHEGLQDYPDSRLLQSPIAQSSSPFPTGPHLASCNSVALQENPEPVVNGSFDDQPASVPKSKSNVKPATKKKRQTTVRQKVTTTKKKQIPNRSAIAPKRSPSITYKSQVVRNLKRTPFAPTATPDSSILRRQLETAHFTAHQSDDRTETKDNINFPTTSNQKLKDLIERCKLLCPDCDVCRCLKELTYDHIVSHGCEAESLFSELHTSDQTDTDHHLSLDDGAIFKKKDDMDASTSSGQRKTKIQARGDEYMCCLCSRTSKYKKDVVVHQQQVHGKFSSSWIIPIYNEQL